MSWWQAAVVYFIAAMPYMLIIIWLLNQLRGEREKLHEVLDISMRQSSNQFWAARESSIEDQRLATEALAREHGSSLPYEDSIPSTVDLVEGT